MGFKGFCQGFSANQLAFTAREETFIGIGKLLKKDVAHGCAQHRIAKELESFIVAREALLLILYVRATAGMGKALFEKL